MKRVDRQEAIDEVCAAQCMPMCRQEHAGTYPACWHLLAGAHAGSAKSPTRHHALRFLHWYVLSMPSAMSCSLQCTHAKCMPCSLPCMTACCADKEDKLNIIMEFASKGSLAALIKVQKSSRSTQLGGQLVLFGKWACIPQDLLLLTRPCCCACCACSHTGAKACQRIQCGNSLSSLCWGW